MVVCWNVVVDMELLLLLFVIAFFCEFIDTSIGGGYGTILTPLAISLGIDPLVIIPAILFSEICTGFLGGFFHYRFRNVDFKIVALDGIIGLIGVMIGAVIGISIPPVLLKTYIGLIVLACGILLVLSFKNWYLVKGAFKLRNDIPLTLLCSFNKGLSGGGYGPISTAGLIIIKSDVKKAVGSTILSEGIVCVIGFLVFVALGKASIYLNPLTLTITTAACLATLPAAYITKKVDTSRIKLAIATFIVLLGIYVLTATFIGLSVSA